MAHMIPSQPKEFDPRSKEGLVFHALSKMSDDYYVFHSVSETVVSSDNTIYEREIDFVIASKKKGILCLEAKAGENIRYEDRTWKYSSGKPMKHGGPYKQIASAKRTLLEKINEHPNPIVRDLASKCKVLHGVFFIDVTASQFKALKGLPEEADERITLFAEDLINPTNKIEAIFKTALSRDKYIIVKEEMNDGEFKLLLDSVLCPYFNLIPSPLAKNIAAEERMNQLLREQYRLFDYLDDQSSAVINGAAGTGKTMLAVEKARRHSMEGEKVLFLCYNKMLCDELTRFNKKNKNKDYADCFSNVDFLTVSKLALLKTGNHSDYDGLLDWLGECLDDYSKFGYRHVIIDEGQDFGLVDSETDKNNAEKNCSIIDSIQMIIEENGGTFYLFYDKYQMIQGKSDSEYQLPECIEKADCRLTLKCNCRNTKEIAKTSVTTLKGERNRTIKINTACSWETSKKPCMHIIDDCMKTVDVLNKVLDCYKEESIGEVVILTTNRLDFSAISDKLQTVENGNYTYPYNGKKYLVTTCKKYKGLESDAVIMIDLDRNSFEGKNGMQFYVGTSRAKLRLDLICSLEDSDFPAVIKAIAPNAANTASKVRMIKIIENTFGAEIVTG